MRRWGWMGLCLLLLPVQGEAGVPRSTPALDDTELRNFLKSLSDHLNTLECLTANPDGTANPPGVLGVHGELKCAAFGGANYICMNTGIGPAKTTAWTCLNVAGSTITTEDDDVVIDAATTTIDYRNNLTATSSPAGEANINAIPSGSTTEIQFNKTSVFAANSGLSFNGASGGTTGDLLVGDNINLDPGALLPGTEVSPGLPNTTDGIVTSHVSTATSPTAALIVLNHNPSSSGGGAAGAVIGAVSNASATKVATELTGAKITSEHRAPVDIDQLIGLDLHAVNNSTSDVSFLYGQDISFRRGSSGAVAQIIGLRVNTATFTGDASFGTQCKHGIMIGSTVCTVGDNSILTFNDANVDYGLYFRAVSSSPIVYEGTANAFETVINFTNPTADRTVTIGDSSGTVLLTSGTVSDVTAGQWTPTTNNIANLDSSSAAEGQYIQVGATVTGSIQLTVDPTTANTSTQLELDLPVASNFGATSDAAGSCGSPDLEDEVGAIRADATSNELEVLWITNSAASHELNCSFSYQII